jgi:hypothetical protein
MDMEPTQQEHRPESGPELIERVSEQYPNVFITLVSVLVGLVLQDLVQEARGRMELWPLTAGSLRTWCQLLSTGGAAVNVWIVFSHIGIVRRNVPTLADSFVAFVSPLLLLAANSFVGQAEAWPWFYCASAYLLSAIVSVRWTVRLTVTEPGLAHLDKLAHFNGVLLVCYLGAPFFACAGWADHQGMLPPWAEAVCAALPVPMTLYAAWLFVQGWRQAIGEQ